MLTTLEMEMVALNVSVFGRSADALAGEAAAAGVAMERFRTVDLRSTEPIGAASLKLERNAWHLRTCPEEPRLPIAEPRSDARQRGREEVAATSLDGTPFGAAKCFRQRLSAYDIHSRSEGEPASPVKKASVISITIVEHAKHPRTLFRARRSAFCDIDLAGTVTDFEALRAKIEALNEAGHPAELAASLDGAAGIVRIYRSSRALQVLVADRALIIAGDPPALTELAERVGLCTSNEINLQVFEGFHQHLEFGWDRDLSEGPSGELILHIKSRYVGAQACPTGCQTG